MRKTIVCVGIMCLVMASVSAQLRDYVCIVRPVYAAENMAFFESTSTKLHDSGYTDLAKYLKDGGGERSGSGCIVNGPGNTLVLVTNRHVVLDAESVDLEFESGDGTSKEYKACTILAIDDTYDLAVIQLPAGFPISRGLTLGSSRPEDGVEIWSAGYPGLGSNPSWQLGKGTITNAAASVKELIDPALTTLLQHSAPVDPGNSGGPLLVTNKSKTAGYEVVGLNTWKAMRMQAANFAMPASMVSAFLGRSVGTSKDTSGLAALTARVKSFADASGETDTDDKNLRIRELSRYISAAYVRDTGYDALSKALASAPSSVRSEMMETFGSSSPLEAFRFACAWQINRILQAAGESAAFSAPAGNPVVAADGTCSIEYGLTNASPFTVRWARYQGLWQIASSSITEAAAEVAKAKAAKKSSSASSIFSLDAMYDYNAGMSFEYRPGYDVLQYGVSCWIQAPYCAFGVYGSTGTVEVTDNYFNDTSDARCVELGGLARLNFPLQFGPITVLPYAEARAGMRVTLGEFDDGNGVVTGFGAGSQFIFGEYPKFFVAPSWNMINLPSGETDSTLCVSAGIGL
mgnify:CR=1 FL=1